MRRRAHFTFYTKFVRPNSTGAYGSTQDSPLWRKEKSYTSVEKEKAVKTWEKFIHRRLPTADEQNRFRHYTRLEEEERIKEQKVEEERVHRRNLSRQRLMGDIGADETTLPKRNFGSSLRPEPKDNEIRTKEQQEEDNLRDVIVDKLVKAERRIMFGADFGSYMLMAHLNNGLELLNEAEELLLARQWMNKETKDKISQLRSHAEKIKFNLEID